MVAGGGVVFDEVYMIGASGEMVSFPTIRAITSPGRPRDASVDERITEGTRNLRGKRVP